MGIRPISLALLLMFGKPLFAQPPQSLDSSAATIAEILHGGRSPRIGAPTALKGDTDRAAAWLVEKRQFDLAFSALKGSWTGQSSSSTSAVRLEFEQRERLVSAEAAAGGYGNLILAWCLRAMNNSMLAQHLAAYPSDRTFIRSLLDTPRIPLLSFSATTDMIEAELQMPRPEEGWRLIEDQKQILKVFDSDGVLRSGRFSWPAEQGIAKMLERRDVAGLIVHMINTDAGDQELLPGLIEYLSRGGSLDDFPIQDSRPYRQKMGDSLVKYRFPPLGLNELDGVGLNLFAAWSKAHAHQKIEFSEVVHE